MYLAELDIPPVVIYALVAMVIAAIQKFSEMGKNKRGNQDAADAASSEFEDLYEEARREINDQQTELPEPPRLTTPRKTPVVLPPSQERHAPPPLPNWQRKVTKPTLSFAEQAALARFQAQPTRSKRQSQSVNSRVRELLSSPSSARDAIVLSEILGTPTSLK
jgi:hypothetical protein